MREFQAETHAKIADAVRRGVNRQLVVYATGLGKTAMAMSIPWNAVEGRMLFLAHRKELLTQAFNAARRWNPGKKVALEHDIFKAREEDDIVIASVQGVGMEGSKRLREFGESHFDTIIVDEAHRSAAAMHLRSIDRFSGHSLLIGLTATPFRHDGIDLANIYDEIVDERGIEWGIENGWLSEVRPYWIRSTVDISDVETRGDDFVESSLDAQVNTDYRNSLIWSSLNEYASDRRRILVFASSVNHAKILAEQLSNHGWPAKWVAGSTSKKEREGSIAWFAEDTDDRRCLVGCDVFIEGFDEPKIDCLVTAKPTKSTGKFCLDEATEILTPDGWKGINDSFDEVYQYYPFDDGRVDTAIIRGRIDRELYRGEQMYGISGRHLNILVTENHRMVVSRRKGRSRSRVTEFVEAGSMPLDGAKVPVAGFESTTGVDLTDDELRFIGLFISDGFINCKTKRVCISQSTRHDFCNRYIEDVMNGCGFGYRKTKVGSVGDATSVAVRKHDLYVYGVSPGRPRGENSHLRGYASVSKYLDKDFSRYLDGCTRDQLLCVIEGLNIGDGAKFQCDSVTWTPRTMNISTGNRVLVDRLSSMCARRGVRFAFREYTNPLSGNINYMMVIDPTRQWISLPNSGSELDVRTKWKKHESYNGRVWCVEVDTGAIICRRNGKNFVTGNCQMIGRGTRIHEYKPDLIVLDIVDVCSTHNIAHVSDMFGVREMDLLGMPLSAAIKKIKDAKDSGIETDGRSIADVDDDERQLKDIMGGRLVELPTKAVQVDLFSRVTKPAPEVDAGSVFKWLKMTGQSYMLPIGRKMSPKLTSDQLGNWRLEYRDGMGVRSHALGKSERPPFKDADKVMKRVIPEALSKPWKMFARNALWRNRPAEDSDISRLRKHGIQAYPTDLTRGAAIDLANFLESGKG